MIRSTRTSTRLGLTTILVTALGLVAPGGASATTTIGQLAPGNSPPAMCIDSDTNLEKIQPTVSSGTPYVVPAQGAVISSWSTKAAADANQHLTFKVWRKVGDPATYQVVGVDGPRTLTPSALNTFPVNIAVQPGDLIGLHKPLPTTDGNSACIFDAPGSNVLEPTNYGNAGVGQSVSFDAANPFPDLKLNLSAVVALKAANDFDITKVKKNKNKGTAILIVDVPGPGELSLSGTGVKTQRAGGARISKDVDAAGKATLKVKAKGTKKQKLLNTGKVKVKAKITFKPSKGTADLPGDPNTEPKKIKLVDN
jgi:hypothetical protein